MKQIAWIGMGVMGAPMAGHLVKAGCRVAAYSRSLSQNAPEMERTYGVEAKSTIREAVEDADCIFVMVGYPRDVEEVFLGPGGILEHAKPGAYAVDMTTSSPALAARLYEEGKKRGIHVLDAPVSGGDTGAKNAALTIMAGGDPEDFQAVLPLLSSMGKTISHMGPAGAGQHTKCCNQICIAGAAAGYTEALVYAQKAGLDPQKVIDAVGGGSGTSWQLVNMGPRVLRGDFAPGFFIKHFIKDMEIIQEESESFGVTLEMLETVLALYQEMADMGYENEGTQALIKYYRQ